MKRQNFRTCPVTGPEALRQRPGDRATDGACGRFLLLNARYGSEAEISELRAKCPQLR